MNYKKYIFYIILGYICYVLTGFSYFYIDVYLRDSLIYILGNSFYLLPFILIIGYNKHILYNLLLLAALIEVLIKAYYLPSYESSTLRLSNFGYVVPLLGLIHSIYRRQYKILLLSLGGIALAYSNKNRYQIYLEKILFLKGHLIGKALALHLVPLLSLSLILLFLLALAMLFLFRKTKKSKPVIVNKPVKINDLDKIFNTKVIDPVFTEKMNKEVRDKAKVLEEILKQYGIDGKVVNTLTGPSVTRFEVSVAKGTRVKKVAVLSDDIAMNLEAKSVRIEAPIPGKNAIGVEIPNNVTEQITFGSLIKKKSKKNYLEVVLGKNIVGDDVLVDLRNMPHLLIAGRTGSGKSVGVNVVISSILYSASPKDVRFIMIDPKMVELMPYNGIPHLYVPVITNPKLAANALNWAVNEMEQRYEILAENGVRHIDTYNQKAKEKIPYLVIIIDELADLMMVAPASIEGSIARIAQKARAVGIHLVIATQRPSIDVITGTIKANLPSRISYAVTSQIDSRTILDRQGAEKLLGKGDLLFQESGKPNLVRIQGAYLSDEEVNKFAQYLRRQAAPSYNNSILEDVENEVEKDILYDRALEIIKEQGKVSTSLIQRKLKIGYSRAARIIDQLEDNGVVRILDNGEKELINED